MLFKELYKKPLKQAKEYELQNIEIEALLKALKKMKVCLKAY